MTLPLTAPAPGEETLTDASTGLLLMTMEPSIEATAMSTWVRLGRLLKLSDTDVVSGLAKEMDVVDPPKERELPMVVTLGKLSAPQSQTLRDCTVWRAVKLQELSRLFDCTVSEKLAAPWYNGMANDAKAALLYT